MAGEIPKSQSDHGEEKVDIVREIRQAARLLAQSLNIELSTISITESTDQSLSLYYDTLDVMMKARGLAPDSLHYIEALMDLGREGTGGEPVRDREPRRPLAPKDLGSIALTPSE